MEVIVQIPDEIHTKFAQQAYKRYGKPGTAKALQEAIALWLEKGSADPKAERILNNQTYQRLKADLYRQHRGKYVVIARGKLQGVGDTLEQVASLAPDARHRLLFRVGEVSPKRKELLWQVRTP